MLSPVWHAKICRGDGFADGPRHLQFEAADANPLQKLLDLSFGLPVLLDEGMRELMEIGRLADMCQVAEVSMLIENEALQLLDLETCGDVLAEGRRSGLWRVEEEGRRLALERFESFAKTAGFLRLGEAALMSLVEDDRLRAEREECVLEAVVRWMSERGERTWSKGVGSSGECEGLLRAVRFQLMDRQYLERIAPSLLPGSEVLQTLLGETAETLMKGKDDLESQEPEPQLGGTGATRGAREEMTWHEDVSERRANMGAVVTCAVVARGRVCCGMLGGNICVWDRSSWSAERTLEGHERMVCGLAEFRGWVISASADRQVRVWDPATGRCERLLWGHRGGVNAVAVAGGRLVSGSGDRTMRVWRMIGAPEEWKWERTLNTADGGSVVCMVGLGPGRVATCLADKAVRGWNVAIGMVERTLRVGRMVGRMVAMAVDWPRLVAASSNGMVLVWSLETGQCERAVQAFPDQGNVHEGGGWEAEEQQRMGKVQCMAVQGSKVVAGTDRGEMLVWHEQTLEVVGVLELPGWPVVRSLVKDREGLMLGCVGSDLVGWVAREVLLLIILQV
jgi:hypothetical protein